MSDREWMAEAFDDWSAQAADETYERGEGGCISAIAVLCFFALIVGAICTGVRWGWFQ